MKILLNQPSLEYLWNQLSKEQQIDFSQQVANNFSGKYLKNYVAHPELQNAQKEIEEKIKEELNFIL